MTRLPALALIFGICLFRPGVVSAMARPGLNDYVSNALVITLVRAQTPDEAAAFPAPVANQRVIVQQVLKGVETRQEFLLPAGSLKPGARGLVLFRFKGEFFELSPTRDKPDPEIVIWSLKDDGIIDIKNTPLEYMRVDIPWRVVNDYVATASPEEVNLNERVTEALLFPEKFKAFATGNARRAAYVRFVIAVRDLGRDVPALAGFLESDDADTRAAAEARLKALTHADVPEPKDDSPAALADWSAAWAKQTLPIQPPKLSDWPAIPANAKQPPDAFPKALLKAVQDGNPD
ncbi:MAG TPA: hypothetical protein VG733_12255, partial [Chthoniobacteraceae bacterium]|nr:hypothetical protein [Chthoniobacteraceae bacterium]